MKIKQALLYFLYGIFAGLAIGMGSIFSLIANTYFNEAGKLVGAMLFSTGLLTIMFLKWELYTGKIGFLFSSDNKKIYLLRLLIIIIGNLLSIILLGFLFALSFSGIPKMNEVAMGYLTSKAMNNDFNGYIGAFISSMLCGGLIYIAVKAFQNSKKIINKIIGVVIPITIFAYMGFHHCIANSFYIGYALAIGWNNIASTYIPTVIVAILGNSIGSILLNIVWPKN